MTKEIKNVEEYNSKMSRSLLDKMFFLDKVPKDIIVIDWGCGNGELLKKTKELFEDNEYYGYDISETMMNIANNKLDNVLVTDNFDDILKNKTLGKKIAINLSSVIHEVYSYRNSEEIDEFWEKVFFHSDYLIIRDMIPSSSMNREANKDDVRKVYKYADGKYLLDFIEKNGDITNNKNLIHYLLKYKYKDNWEREVRENYFTITKEQLYSKIPEDFSIRYEEHFVLPYIQRIVENDFDIKIKDNTHLKLILDKK